MMMNGADPGLDHLPRNLQTSALHSIHISHPTLASQLGADFDPTDPHAFHPFPSTHPSIGDTHQIQPTNAFDPTHRSRLQSNGHTNTPPRPPGSENGFQPHPAGQFGVLASGPELPSQPLQHDSIGRLQRESNLLDTAAQTTQKCDGHFPGLKLVPNPADLQKWRERLFNVEETITMTEDEFNTYFPHVDNVYSHRSTQRYKRKSFVSHYWDCRLKGRPPGTPKSTDPDKRKRQRTARQRDLCDVKIKITEFTADQPDKVAKYGFDPQASDVTNARKFFATGQSGTPPQQTQPFGILTPSSSLPLGHPVAAGAKYYTIQRVNGNGGNQKSDGAAGPHKHTLEFSDQVKKNSVQRWLLKEAKEKKKTQAQQKTYHKKATGQALNTVKKHAKESELKLFGSCFCPFVQRVWIGLEVKGIPYQYVEVDPYKKPESLLEVNPKGLVPAIRHGNWACYESSVLLEYLEDLSFGNPLLPPADPQLRAHCRLWADHPEVNRHIIPLFYRTLQEQDSTMQISHAEELKEEISKLVNASHVQGPFFLGPSISFVDIHFAPWMLRLSRVMKPYRGWPDPEVGSRWAQWLEAVEENEHVKATTSTDDLYLDSYERYAENRPDTSQLARAINAGRSLP